MRRLLAFTILVLAPLGTLAEGAHAQGAGAATPAGPSLGYVVYDTTPGVPAGTPLPGATVVAVPLDRPGVPRPSFDPVGSWSLPAGRWLVYVVLPAGHALTSAPFHVVTLEGPGLTRVEFSGMRLPGVAPAPRIRTGSTALDHVLVDENGGVFTFGDMPFIGSVPQTGTPAPEAPGPAPETPEPPSQGSGAGVDMPGLDQAPPKEEPRPETPEQPETPEPPEPEQPQEPEQPRMAEEAEGEDAGYEPGDMTFLVFFGRTGVELREEDRQAMDEAPPVTDEELDRLDGSLF